MLALTSPQEIWAHRLPAGAKLAALCLSTILLFALKSPLTLGLALLAVLALIASGGPAFLATSLRMLRPLWPFVLVVALWHLWLRDPAGGAVVILRMLTAVAAANFVTMTTRLSGMIAVIERLARPLAPLLPPRRLALAIALVLRFLPVMLERSARIGESWKARSARRPGWRLLVPVSLAALDDAEQVADALRARGGAG
jgi:biotin transport system permease protein